MIHKSIILVKKLFTKCKKLDKSYLKIILSNFSLGNANSIGS